MEKLGPWRPRGGAFLSGDRRKGAAREHRVMQRRIFGHDDVVEDGHAKQFPARTRLTVDSRSSPLEELTIQWGGSTCY